MPGNGRGVVAASVDCLEGDSGDGVKNRLLEKCASQL